MSFPKHEPSKKTKDAKKTRLTLADMPHVADAAPVVDMTGVEVELARIAQSSKSYNYNACDGEMSFTIGLHMGENQQPIRLAFECEAVDRIADALSRIADAMAPKAAEQPGIPGRNL